MDNSLFRNHNLLGSVDQDPGVWGLDSIVARAARYSKKSCSSGANKFKSVQNFKVQIY